MLHMGIEIRAVLSGAPTALSSMRPRNRVSTKSACHPSRSRSYAGFATGAKSRRRSPWAWRVAHERRPDAGAAGGYGSVTLATRGWSQPGDMRGPKPVPVPRRTMRGVKAFRDDHPCTRGPAALDMSHSTQNVSPTCRGGCTKSAHSNQHNLSSVLRPVSCSLPAHTAYCAIDRHVTDQPL
jgi:hypothetical protein